VELLRPVPLRPLELTVAPLTEGRAVDRLVARLSCDGREVAIATAVRIRRVPVDVPAPPPPPRWPAPEALPGFRFHFFRHEVAFHRAVELRPVSGAWGSTPIAFWTRLAVPLVAGRPLLPAERVVVMADAQSGMGVPLDPARFTFVNPDLTVHLARDPIGAWVGFDIRSVAHGSGVGLAQSAIRDADGEIGRSAQGLVVAARG
jgi:hypothetical protein